MKIAELSAGIFGAGITLILINSYFEVLDIFIQTKRNKRFQMMTSESNKKNYNWISKTDLFEEDFYRWLNVAAERDVIYNLQKLRKEIKETLGDNIYDIYLIKDYITYYSENNFLSKTWNFLKVVLTTVITGIIGKFAIEKLIDILGNHQSDKVVPYIEYINVLIYLGMIIIAIIIVINFMRRESLRDRKTLDILKIILDSIIKEHEDLKNN